MKLISMQEAVSMIKDGSSVMAGGFMGNGGPNEIMEALSESDVSGLTLISNDTATPEIGVGRLIVNKKVSKLIATHIGLNPETGKQMMNKELVVELIPQGTFAERVRCGGTGLGGFLTPTGIGTIVEQGKSRFNMDGVDYLLEKPLKADIAVLRGTIVDMAGNIYYKGSTRNFNPLMAAAAETVIVFAEKLVQAGEIEPELVMTPGIFVDYVVRGGEDGH